MNRKIRLPQLYVSIKSNLDKEYRDVVENFDTESASAAMFVVLLHSAHENFLRMAFDKMLVKSDLDSEALETLRGKLGNFSMKSDFPLFCSIFLPNQYEKSEVRKKMIDFRNAYAHRFFDHRGRYISYSNDKYTLDLERLREFYEYSTCHMKTIAEAVDSVNAELDS